MREWLALTIISVGGALFLTLSGVALVVYTCRGTF